VAIGWKSVAVPDLVAGVPIKTPVEAFEKGSYARRTKHVPAKAGIQIDDEAYTVRRSDEGRVQRRRWPFLGSLYVLGMVIWKVTPSPGWFRIRMSPP
jgi:hypothetical protein